MLLVWLLGLWRKIGAGTSHRCFMNAAIYPAMHKEREQGNGLKKIMFTSMKPKGVIRWLWAAYHGVDAYVIVIAFSFSRN